MLVRLWAALSGLDGPHKRALPIGEFLHPIAIGAVLVLALNDHVLKGSGLLPGLVTGKLSDFAGLAFFPLLLTALLDLGLWLVARTGLRIDFSLRWWKLIAASIATALFFAAIKLDASAAETVAGWLSIVGWHSTIVADPTDLLALSALFVPLWIGRAELRRVPLGRLEVLRRGGWKDQSTLERELRDIGPPHTVSAVAGAFSAFVQTGEAEPLDKLLHSIRFSRKQASGELID